MFQKNSKGFLGNHQIPTPVRLYIQGNLQDVETWDAQVAKLRIAR